MITPKDILLVDLDFEYSKFKRYFLDFYLEHINLILSRFNLRALSVEFYRSTNGNTHVKALPTPTTRSRLGYRSSIRKPQEAESLWRPPS
jgi:3-methyladenine DNA glycosylase AlkC